MNPLDLILAAASLTLCLAFGNGVLKGKRFSTWNAIIAGCLSLTFLASGLGTLTLGAERFILITALLIPFIIAVGPAWLAIGTACIIVAAIPFHSVPVALGAGCVALMIVGFIQRGHIRGAATMAAGAFLFSAFALQAFVLQSSIVLALGLIALVPVALGYEIKLHRKKTRAPFAASIGRFLLFLSLAVMVSFLGALALHEGAHAFMARRAGCAYTILADSSGAMTALDCRQRVATPVFIAGLAATSVVGALLALLGEGSLSRIGIILFAEGALVARSDLSLLGVPQAYIFSSTALSIAAITYAMVIFVEDRAQAHGRTR